MFKSTNGRFINYMITREVLDRILNCKTITNSLVLKYPITEAVSDARDIVMQIDLSDLEEFETACFFNRLSNFLSLTKLYDDFSITENNEILTIKDNNSKSSIDFVTSSLSLMSDYSFDPVQFTKTEDAVSIQEFELSSQEIAKLKTAGNTLQNIDSLKLSNQGDELNVRLESNNIYAKVGDGFTIVKDIPSTKQFQISIPFENFIKLPTQNYKFFVKYNSKNNSYRVLIHNLDNDKIKILLSVNV